MARMDEPTLNDILEALEMMTLPLSSPTDTSGALTSWTLDEHEKFIQGQRMYRDGPYERIASHIQTKYASEVETYGIQCWESEKNHQFVASPQSQYAYNEVKDEPGHSSPPHEHADETLKKQHRVRKWFREAFKWCVEVLSFRCLRHQEIIVGGVFDNYPVQRSRPAFSTTHPDDSIFIGSLILPRGPVIQSTDTFTYAPATANSQRESNSGASASNFEFVGRFRSSNSQHEPRFRMDAGKMRADVKRDNRSTNLSRVALQYESSLAFSDEEEDHDDWKMIKARRAASEIEWFDAIRESPASSAPTMTKPVKNRGVWSTDEHERYCEGVKLFRYGSWKRIADHVGTRTVSQVTSHAQSVRAKKLRCEEREKRCQTRSIPRNSASAHGLVKQITSHKPTAEELLIASMPIPIPTHDTRPTNTTAVISCDDSSDTNTVAIEKSREAEFHRALQVEKLCSDEFLDSDVPLCSPPSSILLSDEDFADLMEITSTPSQSPVAA